MASRRLRAVRVCVLCAAEYRPCHKQQRCCSRTCAAIMRARMAPQHYQMAAARAKLRREFAKRLGEQLRGMSPGEIWRYAYRRGYTAGWTKATQNSRQAEAVWRQRRAG